jgi:hypothetical protein
VGEEVDEDKGDETASGYGEQKPARHTTPAGARMKHLVAATVTGVGSSRISPQQAGSKPAESARWRFKGCTGGWNSASH